MKKITLSILSIIFVLLNVQSSFAQIGAVYAMTNGEGQIDGNVQGPNSVVAYGQAEDGTLSIIGTYPTGGNGGDYDGGEGLDPLISAYAITKSNDNRFVMAVNAGSNTITSMRVNEDFTLTVVDTESTEDIGPNSIAYQPSRRIGVNGIVYVSNITRPAFLDLGEPGHQGSIIGYRLTDNGDLEPIAGSRRELATRPSAIQISPDGDFIVVASINSGAAGLGSGSEDEIVVYGLNADGMASADQLAGGTSTLRGNAEGRNLPSAIGFQIVGDNYVVVTEAREFQPDGAPPAFPALQDGSVSTWQIANDGSLTPISLDVASGENNTGRTACWLDFSDENTFFVSNAIEAGLASYSFDNGVVELINQTAAQGTGATGNTTDPGAAFATTEGWIDLWISDDGQYLYQCYGLTGEIGVYAIDGAELSLVQEIGGLPQNNVQGIVSVGAQPANNEITAQYRVTFDALWSQVSHPNDFPLDPPNEARWSPVVGLTHNSSVRLFNEGDIATPGLVNISQSGSRDPLDVELANVILSGAGEFYVESDTRVRPSPDTISTSFEISSSHPLVSLTSMIAPSPDWIVAARDVELFQNGEFVESMIVQFAPYDTGSDSGDTFRSDNLDTQPREPITAITDGILATDGRIPSLGFFRFERIDSGSTCNVEGGTLSGQNFTFTVDGIADNIPEGALTVSNNFGDSQIVVTDDSGNILGLPPTFSAPDFDAAGVGLCYVYHMSYDGALTGLAVGNNIAEIEGCFDLSNQIYVKRELGNNQAAVGAVFAMTNGEGQVPGNVQGPNSIVAYGQAEDGTLSIIGTYPTGGNGGDYDGGEGLDPLISAYALTKTVDNRFVLAVNAGSNTITSMRVNDDYSLTVIDTEDTEDIGPNSIAHKLTPMAGVNGLVYVSNITRPEFLADGEPGQQGSIIGFRLMDDGSLEPVANSQRDLANRPSAVQFSPDGDFLVVASINAGAAGLANGNQDEIVVYGVNSDGTLSANQLAGATSTLRGNAANRNLPSAIGFQIVGDNYVVVTEAREFQANGAPPAFPALQDGSVSTWQIQADGSLSPIDLDVASGENNTGRTACWLDFSDENTFFVSNAIEAGLAAYSFNDGDIELLNQTAAQGTGATGNTTDPGTAFATTEGWIDLWISDDGQYLYQCYGLTGEIGVYAIDGAELSLVQEIGGLPINNVQGIVSVGTIGNNPNVQGTDLSLDISVGNSLYENFEEVDYTITITNEGSGEATNVIVSAGLPEGTVFTDAIESAGEYDLFFEEWTIDALAAGETATLDLTVFTLVEGEDIINFVEVVAADQDDTDSTPANGNGSTPAEDDEAAVVITPAEDGGFSGQDGEANLSLAIDSDTDLFDQYENITFTITLTNDGPDAATDIEVAAGLPDGLVFTSDNTSAGDYNLFFETWTIDALESGETAVLELELFTLISDGPIRAYAEVFSAGQLDPNSTPGNGNGVTAAEDDEAVVLIEALNASATATVNNAIGSKVNGSEVTMHRLYPVPATDELTLELVSELEDASEALITVYNLQGQKLMNQAVNLAKGFNQTVLNVRQLNEGTYLINVISEGKVLTTQRFTKIGF